MEPMIAEISALPAADESELVPELPKQRSKTFLNLFRGAGQLARTKAKSMRENPGQTNLPEMPALSSVKSRKNALLKKGPKGPMSPFMMDEKEVNGMAKLAGIDMDEMMNFAKTGEVNPIKMNQMMGNVSNMAMKSANMLVAHPKLLEGTVNKMMD